MARDRTDPPVLNNDALVRSRRYMLPNDLPAAIKHLNNGELDELEAAVNAEQRNRGRKTFAPAIAPSTSREATSATLTVGKLNAVRASFEAGVTSAKIAREFGIPQSEVRKAVASFVKKKGP